MPLSVGLVTLNARYIHSSLSLRYLRNAARRAGVDNVWLREYVISDPLWRMAAEVGKNPPDILGIGIYIWNRRQSFDLIEILQKQHPRMTIVIGGPEVSFDTEPPPGCILIAGEAEQKWIELLRCRAGGNEPSEEMLRRWRVYGTDLPELHPAYTEEDRTALQNRFAYIETSRGCPYSCSFCLSALDKTVRYFDDETVREQIELVVDAGARAVKFVDRTFNLQPGRVIRLMQWLADRFPGRAFHFEIVGDLLSEELLGYLDTVPEGIFQFEIGVQTATEDVQPTIRRKQDNGRLFAAINRLIRSGRIHIHADLIFGLPGESMQAMLDSFAQILALRPHELQLGFLKFLPGAPVNKAIEDYQYRHASFPPYEVISNKDVSAAEFLQLKHLEEVFNVFYNSRRFVFTVDHCLERYSPAELFGKLSQQVVRAGVNLGALGLEDQYRLLMETVFAHPGAFEMDLLKLDYLYGQRVFHLPRFMMGGNRGRYGKAWPGDRKTPLVPFSHEISVIGDKACLLPSDKILYYAVVHPDQAGVGYFRRPRIVLADSPE